MIGSLIYFGLYPLTKLLSTLSEFWWNSHPVYINGKALWSGGGNPSKSPNEQQSTWLDWWYNTEPCEAMEDFPQKKEQITPARQNEAFDMLGSPEMKKQKFQDGRKTNHGMEAADNQPMVSVSAAEERSRDHVSSSLAVEKTKGPQAYRIANTSRETADVAKETEHTDCTLATQSRVEIFASESMPNEVGGTESLVSAGTPVYNRSTLLADSHTPMLKNHMSLQSAPTGWHFPVGLGLSEVAHCPIGYFPGMSYYPACQESSNFEVTWRVWEDFSENVNNSQSPYEACTDPESKFEFTVMSYNILAQDLLEANSSLYTHCPEEVLMWEIRFITIVKELQTWQPDIICLQEVQENHFLRQMQPVLTELGYNCVYKRRTGSKTDGCAVCYQAKRFTQLSVSLLEFRREGIELLDRDNVGIVLLLQPIAARCQRLTFRPICVANTHLLFNPRRGEVKLAQLAIVLAEIDSVVKKCKVNGHDCETILCGDLNSVPNMPLYQLITTGQLYYHGLPCWMVSGQEDLSYKLSHKRLYAPLWPSSLGINDECQYSHYPRPSAKESGKLHYSHDFLRQLRFCPPACVRPPDLKLIKGVTDTTPSFSFGLKMPNVRMSADSQRCAPLWPSSLGINDDSQYSQYSRPSAKESGKLQYSHDFLWQLRFCPAACVRPPDLKLIPRVTDNTPNPDEPQTFTPRNFRNTVYHHLNLKSAYSQNIAGTGRSAVSTLHSAGAAMVDYIFYSPGSNCEATGKKNGLKLLGRLSLLSEDDLWSLNGLPNHVFPSDHLSLLAKFQLC